MISQVENLKQINSKKIKNLQQMIDSSSAVRNDFKRAVRCSDDISICKYLLRAGFKVESSVERAAGLLIGFFISMRADRNTDGQIPFAYALKTCVGENFDNRFQRLMKCTDGQSLSQLTLRLARTISGLHKIEIDLVSLYMDLRYLENNLNTTQVKWIQQFYSSDFSNEDTYLEAV